MNFFDGYSKGINAVFGEQVILSNIRRILRYFHTRKTACRCRKRSFAKKYSIFFINDMVFFGVLCSLTIVAYLCTMRNILFPKIFVELPILPKVPSQEIFCGKTREVLENQQKYIILFFCTLWSSKKVKRKHKSIFILQDIFFWHHRLKKQLYKNRKKPYTKKIFRKT